MLLVARLVWKHELWQWEGHEVSNLTPWRDRLKEHDRFHLSRWDPCISLSWAANTRLHLFLINSRIFFMYRCHNYLTHFYPLTPEHQVKRISCSEKIPVSRIWQIHKRLQRKRHSFLRKVCRYIGFLGSLWGMTDWNEKLVAVCLIQKSSDAVENFSW